MISAGGTDMWSGLRFLAVCIAVIAAIVLVVWLIARSRGTTASLAVRAAMVTTGILLASAVIAIVVTVAGIFTTHDVEVSPSTSEDWSEFCSAALACEGSTYLATDVNTGPRLLIAAGRLCTIAATAAPLFALFVLCRSALRNSVFPAWLPRLLVLCGVISLTLGSIAPILTEMGNGLAAAQVLPDEAFVSYYFVVPWWPALTALACAALAAIFRHGARLQHDTEGLV